MPQIFRRRANALAITIPVLGVLLTAGLLVAAALVVRSPYATGVDRTPGQPVPFSHQHHVGGLGIDCRYCHAQVERSASAGVPATEVCMTCHSQLWTDADMLQPVRDSLAQNEPIAWTRVHDLPDFVYFDHSVHVNHGVGCESCHGRIDKMPLTTQKKTLHMQWCLDCHRQPERHLRPAAHVFDMAWQPPRHRRQLGDRLKQQYGTPSPQRLTDCYTCHR